MNRQCRLYWSGEQYVMQSSLSIAKCTRTWRQQRETSLAMMGHTNTHRHAHTNTHIHARAYKDDFLSLCYLIMLSIAKVKIHRRRWRTANWYRALLEWYCKGKAEILEGRRHPVTRGVPKILHELNWHWIRDSLGTRVLSHTTTFLFLKPVKELQ